MLMSLSSQTLLSAGLAGEVSARESSRESKREIVHVCVLNRSPIRPRYASSGVTSRGREISPANTAESFQVYFIFYIKHLLLPTFQTNLPNFVRSFDDIEVWQSNF